MVKSRDAALVVGGIAIGVVGLVAAQILAVRSLFNSRRNDQFG